MLAESMNRPFMYGSFGETINYIPQSPYPLLHFTPYNFPQSPVLHFTLKTSPTPNHLILYSILPLKTVYPHPHHLITLTVIFHPFSQRVLNV